MCQALVCVRPTACGRLVTLQWTRPPLRTLSRIPKQRNRAKCDYTVQRVVKAVRCIFALVVSIRTTSSVGFHRSIPRTHRSQTCYQCHVHIRHQCVYIKFAEHMQVDDADDEQDSINSSSSSAAAM